MAALFRSPVDVRALAFRALGGPSRSERDFPLMFAGVAHELPHPLHFAHPPFYLKGLPFDDSLGDLCMGRMDDVAESLPGYLHPLGRILLIKPFQVSQPDRLKLVETQNDLLEFGHGDAARLEIGYVGLMRHETAFEWSGHALLLAYAN